MKKKKTLHLDGKKRVTLGKFIAKETTFFEVEKKADGTLILHPKTDLPEDETWVYQNKAAFKALKLGLKNLRKGLFTKIENDFWSENNSDINEFRFTKEFLQKLEPIIVKQDLKMLENIKTVLEQIATNEVITNTLQNIKTDENKEIYQTAINEKVNVFWTEKNSQKIFINLIRRIDK